VSVAPAALTVASGATESITISVTGPTASGLVICNDNIIGGTRAVNAEIARFTITGAATVQANTLSTLGLIVMAALVLILGSFVRKQQSAG
jgi:hypothetical protein